jgi:hypothetical protein
MHETHKNDSFRAKSTAIVAKENSCMKHTKLAGDLTGDLVGDIVATKLCYCSKIKLAGDLVGAKKKKSLIAKQTSSQT